MSEETAKKIRQDHISRHNWVKGGVRGRDKELDRLIGTGRDVATIAIIMRYPVSIVAARVQELAVTAK